ncbi:MAG: Fe(3+) dicitrate transport protein [Chitinophagales bacterium]|jgi:Fe(3+) dicitrate transport protein
MRLIVLILSLFYVQLHAQSRFIQTLDENGTALSDASIYCLQNSYEFKSNKQGVFFLPDSLPNLLNFSCYAEAYQTQTISFDFSKGHSLQIKFAILENQLTSVEVTGSEGIGKFQMKGVEDMGVYESKKSEKIEITKISANLATNNSRQIYGKVAGINIWESTGSGLSTELGGRGLSPERSSNFNVRQNGYDISADALGYPDAYYVPPAAALKQIEIVRGASSLQYGTQFGGIINYQLQEPSEETLFHFKIRQTAGSYGFSNTHLQLDGTKNKFSYISISQYKRGNAWRGNSGFDSWFSYNKVGFRPIEKLSIDAEYTFYYYLAQQAGGLTDRLFEENDQQSIRDRNFFRINWHLPQIEINYKFSSRLKFQTITFGLIAQRDALGFLGNITRVDPLEERDLLVDYYKNFGNETRLMYKYKIFGNLNTFVIGARFYKGNTQKQQGLGSDGFDANFSYLNPNNLENSDYTFPSRNIALFAEHIFKFTARWSVTPGVRLENIATNAKGYYREITEDLAGNILIDTSFNEILRKKRTFVISGIGSSFKINESQEVYASISQNYRAVNFNDLRILNVNAQVDPNLEDEKGFNADFGYRGSYKDLIAFDISAFYLFYRNRIGFTLEYDSVRFNLYRLRTNVSSSRNIGVESVFEIDYLRLGEKVSKDFSFKQLINFSYIDGRYTGTKESAFRNKKVELVPNVIFRTSLGFSWKELVLSSQFSYVGQQFTDATNSLQSADAVNGIVPSYFVMDLSLKYEIKKLTIEGNINNLLNNSYFTRRATGYPGPGIIPSDRRTFYLTLGYQFNSPFSKNTSKPN